MQAIVRSRRWRVIVAIALAAALGFTLGDTTTAGAGDTTEIVYIATGENFPDALGAAAAAGINAGPVLLVQQSAIPSATLNELNRLQPEKIIIVGGTGVIADSVKTALEALGFNPTVERVAGADRYATAAALSAATYPVTTGDIFHVNTGTGNQTISTTTWTEVATGVVVVPEGEEVYLVITFNAEASCTSSNALLGWCSLRALVNGTEASPAVGTDYAFDSSDEATESFRSWEARTMIRISGPHGPGTYDVAIEAANREATGSLRIDDWALVIEGKKT